jgi:cytochrome c5
MSGSHEKLPKLFWIQLILVAIVGVLYLFAPKSEQNHNAEATESHMKAAAETLAPVGAVAVKSEDTASAGGARSGEAIYKETCQTCHAAGIANAPKLDDKAAWEPRVANGLDGLLKTAINGMGAMPPRGGNPAISDEEMKSTILYMTSQAGFDLASSSMSETSTQTDSSTLIAKEPEATVAVKEPEAPKVVKEPVAPVAPAAPVPPAPKTAIAAVPAAITPPAAEPVAAIVEEQKPVPVAETTITPAIVDTAAGEKVYKSSCFACHDAGVAGSPKIADKAAWAPRIATGSDAMYNSAINGKGVMPPKGGNMGIADADVKAAVDYMVSQSQ